MTWRGILRRDELDCEVENERGRTGELDDSVVGVSIIPCHLRD